MNEPVISPDPAAERAWRSLAGPVPDFEGCHDLHSLAGRYVELRLHMGYKFHGRGKPLFEFADFQKSRGLTRPENLTIEDFLSFFESRSTFRDSTWNRYLSTISLWLDHLKAIGRLKRNPSIFLRRRARSDYVPYIFSREELRQIFHPDTSLASRKERAVMYHLVYACGLRASEVGKLTFSDLDREAKTIFIRKSKFSKDRILPVHPRVFERVEDHLRTRPGGCDPMEPEARLFPTPTGMTWKGRRLSYEFREDLLRLGIYRKTKKLGGLVMGSPRLHALRHSMACHRLIRWYREGADVQAKLPILSTYLGHANWVFTQVYLKVTALVLREADRRFRASFEREFPLEP
jgi:integrase/recombinase XerD